MTPPQFNALATLLRLRQGETRAVAQDVLVNDKPLADAAREHGMTYGQAHKLMVRVRRGIDLVKQAA